LDDIKRWIVFIPMLDELSNPAMRDRHWKQIKEKVQKDFEVNEKLLLRDIWNLNLNKISEEIEEITDQAK
jgi:dynein heavy chain